MRALLMAALVWSARLVFIAALALVAGSGELHADANVDEVEKENSASENPCIAGELGEVLLSARMIPKIKERKVIGFELVEANENSFYTKSKLKVGDLVLKLNGIAWDNPTHAMEAYASLGKKNKWEIQRTGKTVVVPFNCPFRKLK